MYQQAPPARLPRPVPLPTVVPARTRRFLGSPLAAITALVLALGFAGTTALRVSGRLAHADLRIVAHIVPERYHPRLLAAVHPLVHLGDAAFVVPVVLLAVPLLWLRGFRHTWAILAIGLSWPLELGCKAIFPQPASLGFVQDTVAVGDLVHGAGSAAVLGWLDHAAPTGLGALMRHAGAATVNLTSSYPSGSTARGAFILGLLIWASLRWGVPVLSEALALALLAPLAGLGFAVVLFAWHWPSDVFGGYLLGLCLLACALALLRRPEMRRASPPSGAARNIPHGRQGALPWVPNR